MEAVPVFSRQFSPLRRTVACLAGVLLVAAGGAASREFELSAEEGLGYGLGILGTTAMVLLLGYSLRKRVSRLRNAGPLRHWFRIHMALGILGPVAILFHANFRLGSLNSSVALATVLLVAGSGVVGRYLYPKVHHGLSGQRATLHELRIEAESRRSSLRSATGLVPAIAQDLADFEAYALDPDRRGLAAAWRFVSLASHARRTRRRSLRRLARALRSGRARPEYFELDVRSCNRALVAYLHTIRQVAELSAYERLFSLWHAFHLPFCLLLLVAAVVHILAVHLY